MADELTDPMAVRVLPPVTYFSPSRASHPQACETAPGLLVETPSWNRLVVGTRDDSWEVVAALPDDAVRLVAEAPPDQRLRAALGLIGDLMRGQSLGLRTGGRTAGVTWSSIEWAGLVERRNRIAMAAPPENEQGLRARLRATLGIDADVAVDDDGLIADVADRVRQSRSLSADVPRSAACGPECSEMHTYQPGRCEAAVGAPERVSDDHGRADGGNRESAIRAVASEIETSISEFVTLRGDATSGFEADLDAAATLAVDALIGEGWRPGSSRGSTSVLRRRRLGGLDQPDPDSSEDSWPDTPDGLMESALGLLCMVDGPAQGWEQTDEWVQAADRWFARHDRVIVQPVRATADPAKADPARALVDWLIAMDDPAELEARRSVTLSEIIRRARLTRDWLDVQDGPPGADRTLNSGLNVQVAPVLDPDQPVTMPGSALDDLPIGSAVVVDGTAGSALVRSIDGWRSAYAAGFEPIRSAQFRVLFTPGSTPREPTGENYTPQTDQAPAADPAALLRLAARGRREYAASGGPHTSLLEQEAATFEQAARIVSGDRRSLQAALPSWRWQEIPRQEKAPAKDGDADELLLVRDADRQDGAVTIGHTRLPAAAVLGLLANGAEYDLITDMYPDLAPAQIRVLDRLADDQRGGPPKPVEATAAHPWTVTLAWTPQQNAGAVSVLDTRCPIFAILGSLAAGETPKGAAAEYGLPVESVHVLDQLRAQLPNLVHPDGANDARPPDHRHVRCPACFRVLDRQQPHVVIQQHTEQLGHDGRGSTITDARVLHVLHPECAPAGWDALVRAVSG